MQVRDSVIITDVTLVDNKIGVMPLLYEPNALSHQTSDKFVRLQNSLVVGMSPDFQCGGIDDVSFDSKVIYICVFHYLYVIERPDSQG